MKNLSIAEKIIKKALLREKELFQELKIRACSIWSREKFPDMFYPVEEVWFEFTDNSSVKAVCCVTGQNNSYEVLDRDREHVVTIKYPAIRTKY